MPVQQTTALLDAEAVLHRAGIREGQTVADLGCGALGHFIFPASKLAGEKGTVYGVDILKSVLAAVSSRSSSEGIPVHALWGNCEEPGGSRVGNEACDITLVINNMYQSKNRLGFLREAARITRPGGTVMVIDWKPTASPFGPPQNLRVPAIEVGGMAVRAGLKPLEEYEPGPYHWGIVFAK